ncbi:hypothetical protein RJ639_001347, partial [Escallonia herrerae]
IQCRGWPLVMEAQLNELQTSVITKGCDAKAKREGSCLVSAYGGGRAHCLTSRKLSHHSLISHHSLHRISKS